LLKIG